VQEADTSVIRPFGVSRAAERAGGKESVIAFLPRYPSDGGLQRGQRACAQRPRSVQRLGFWRDRAGQAATRITGAGVDCAPGNPRARGVPTSSRWIQRPTGAMVRPGGARTHKRPRRPSRWSTRAAKTFARTRRSMTASTEGHCEK